MLRTPFSNSTDLNSTVDSSMFVKTDLPVVLVHNLAADTAADTEADTAEADIVVVATAQEDMADLEADLEDVVDMVEDIVAEVMAAVDMVVDIMVVDMLMALDMGREGEDMLLLGRMILPTLHLPEATHLLRFLSRMYPRSIIDI